MVRLKELRKKNKLTQKELAEKLNLDTSSISKYESSASTPSQEVLLKLAKLFNVTTDYLLGNEDFENKSTKKGIRIPVLGYVAAGIPVEAIEDIVDWEEIPEEMARTGEYFGLVINGNSMEPRICKGDVVIVRKQPDIESGETAIILVNGDSGTCKKVVKHTNGISLVSLNPIYEPLFFTNEEIATLPVQILGKVVELRGKF